MLISILHPLDFKKPIISRNIVITNKMKIRTNTVDPTLTSRAHFFWRTIFKNIHDL
jgi:hypothetical protein